MRKVNFTQVLLVAWVGAIAVSYNACGGFKASSGNSLFGSDPVPIFEKTVHPIVVEHCAGCHADAISPMFAAPTAAAAFEQVQSSIDMAAPERSRLLQKLLTGHNCWSGNCDDDGEELLAALQDFVTQLGEQNIEDPRITLEAIAIPGEGVWPDGSPGGIADPTVPFETLSWSLASVGAPGATLTIDAQQFGPETYKFANPRLNNLPENFWVKGLYLKLNGASRDKESTWVAIDIMDTELVNRQLTDAPLHVSMEMDSEGEPIGADLQPAFEVIEGVGGTPKNVPTFSQVQGIINASCMPCHGGGGAERPLDSYDGITGTPLVDDDGDPMTAEVAGKKVVLPGNFVDSILYMRVTMTTGMPGAMPPGGPSISTNDMDTIRTWILGGAQQ